MTPYEELANCSLSEREKVLNKIINDDFLANLLLSEINEKAKKYARYSGLNNFDYNEVANNVLILIHRNDYAQLYQYCKRTDCSLDSFIRQDCLSCAYTSVAEKNGMTRNDFQKMNRVKKVWTTNNIEPKKENAWLINRISGIPITVIIRAIDNYKRANFLEINETTDKYIYKTQASLG